MQITTNFVVADRSATVVGCGNIGSHAVPHLVRNGLNRLVLVDADQFERRNLANQNISSDQVGNFKSTILADMAMAISPDLTVDAITRNVEDVPLGQLRSTVILACTDSRISRMAINAISWRLNIPMIDCAVGIREGLARVSTYRPSDSNPCLECTWSAEDYAALEQTYACRNESSATTNLPQASSSLGGLAASIAATECEKILDRVDAPSLVSSQRLIGVFANEHRMTTVSRNPQCRFDHATLSRVEPIDIDPFNTTIGRFINHCTERRDIRFSKLDRSGLRRTATLSVVGQTFTHAVACRNCTFQREQLVLTRVLRIPIESCPDCQGPLAATGLGTTNRLSISQLCNGDGRTLLSQLGIRRHDIISIRADQTRHFELAGGNDD